jgi:hypothetical protein
MIPGLPFEPPPGTPGAPDWIPPGTPGSPQYIPPGLPGSPEYHPSRRRVSGIRGPGGRGKPSGWAVLVVVAIAVLFVGVLVWILVVGFSVIGAS